MDPKPETDLTIGTILIVLSEREREQFFPGDSWQKLLDLAGGLQSWHLPESLGTAGWLPLLAESKPSAVVAGWSLPPLDAAAIEACPSLRYLCYLTGSVKSKLPRLFFERGGMASNWGGEISRTVAECALTLALGCLRQVPKFYREMMIDKKWRARHATDIPRSLYGRRVGIHGYGNVARELIKLLAPFQCPVQVWSEPVPASVFVAAGVKQATSLSALFAENEIIFEVEALTDSSLGSVNESVLAALRAGGVFVNVGRGPVVDEAALLQRAQRGDISVGLDVYAQEPLAAESPLRELPNALLFPHMAGPTQDHYPVCGQAALANLEAWRNGHPLLNPFTLAHYDRTT